MYAILVNLIQRTNGCIITSVNNNSNEFLYYRDLPYILKTDKTHGLSMIDDDEFAILLVDEARTIEYLVLTGVRYLQLPVTA